MNCRAIAPLFQGLAAEENRLAAKNAFKNAIADHQGRFPLETPGYFGKVGADVTTPARKGKRRNQSLLPALPPPVGNPATPCVDPITVAGKNGRRRRHGAESTRNCTRF
jgi:hypothetical protein